MSTSPTTPLTVPPAIAATRSLVIGWAVPVFVGATLDDDDDEDVDEDVDEVVEDAGGGSPTYWK